MLSPREAPPTASGHARSQRGRRFAFLAFLYGEADAALRRSNNAKLHQGEERYSGLSDRLFPEDGRDGERQAS